MLISFTQSGGFAGLVRRCRVDSGALGSEERARVEGRVAPVHVVCDDSCVPPEARPLVAYLKERAK